MLATYFQVVQGNKFNLCESGNSFFVGWSEISSSKSFAYQTDHLQGSRGLLLCVVLSCNCPIRATSLLNLDLAFDTWFLNSYHHLNIT